MLPSHGEDGEEDPAKARVASAILRAIRGPKATKEEDTPRRALLRDTDKNSNDDASCDEQSQQSPQSPLQELKEDSGADAELADIAPQEADQTELLQETEEAEPLEVNPQPKETEIEIPPSSTPAPASSNTKSGCLNTGKSLFLFGPENAFRRAVIDLEARPWFDTSVLVVIIISTVMMAMSSPVWFPHKSAVFQISEDVDFGINIIFTIEMLIHIISKGFIFGEGAYLRSTSYQLDFLVVSFSWIELFNVKGMPNMKPFRAFRAMRALRAIKFLTYCSAIMEALGDAFPHFGDIAAVTAFLLTIFGIMAVQIYAGAMARGCQWLKDGEALSFERACQADIYKGVYDTHTSQFTDDPRKTPMGYTCPRGAECVIGENPNDGVFHVFACKFQHA